MFCRWRSVCLLFGCLLRTRSHVYHMWTCSEKISIVVTLSLAWPSLNMNPTTLFCVWPNPTAVLNAWKCLLPLVKLNPRQSIWKEQRLWFSAAFRLPAQVAQIRFSSCSYVTQICVFVSTVWTTQITWDLIFSIRGAQYILNTLACMMNVALEWQPVQWKPNDES